MNFQRKSEETPCQISENFEIEVYYSIENYNINNSSKPFYIYKCVIHFQLQTSIKCYKYTFFQNSQTK